MEETGRQRFLRTYGHRRSVLRQRFSHRNLKKRPPGQTFSRTSITSFLVPTKKNTTLFRQESEPARTRPRIASDSRRSREPQFPTIGTSKRIYRQTKIYRHGQNRRSMTVRHTDTVAQTERSGYRDGETSGSYPAQSRTKNPKRTGRPFGRTVLFGFFFPDRNYCARNHMDFTVERKYGDRPFRTRRKSRHSGDRNSPDRTHGHGSQTAASSRPSPPPRSYSPDP